MFARIRQFNWLLAAILLLSLGLRLWGINSGLPYMNVADESLYATIALRMFITGDLNPHWLLYPTFWLYLNTLAHIPFFLVAKLAGDVTVPSDIPYPVVQALAVGLSQMPAQIMLGRGLTAIFSAATVGAVYVAARDVFHHRAGPLLAALLIAVSPISVSNSKSLRPEAYATFFIVLSFLWSYRILAKPRLRNYVLAGAFAGLAASSKYNAGLILLSMLTAHWICFGAAGLRRKEIYFGIAASMVAFGLTTPFGILEISSLFDNLTVSASVYSTGYKSLPGSGLVWYLQHLWQTEGLLVLLAIAQVSLLAVRRSPFSWVLLAFPLGYFIFVSMLAVRNDRTILPVIPFLGILAAQFTVGAARWLVAHMRQVAWAPNGAFALLVALQTIPPLGAIFQNNIRITQTDARDAARVWIETNLPAGSRVALEAYSPFIDPGRFVVEGVGAIPDHPPDWYAANGFEYLVFSSGMYGRFFANPARSANWVDRYNQFFASSTEVGRFDENGYEVRLYKTGAKLPSQRVAARFGDRGDLIELVGYDVAASRWTVDDPLTLTLYWRALATKDEPLEVNLRLLDKDDREVGRVRGDLFQEQGWREGMISTEWAIPVRENATAGAHRVEVEVIQSRYNYQTPAQNWTGDKFERVTLGPLKMSARAPTTNELQSLRQVDVHFGDAIALLGFASTQGSRAGRSPTLTLYWQSIAKPSRDYTVFIHLIDANGQVVAQVDAQPRGGAYPTSLWDAGEILADDYVMPLPADLAPGSYRIEIGLYEYPSLTRLAAADAKGGALGDHWLSPNALLVIQ